MNIGTLVTGPDGVVGTVDAVSVHPDGSALLRINDAWFFAVDCYLGER